MLDRHESAHSHTHRKILAIEKLCSRLSLRARCQHKHRIIHTLNDHCICIFSLSLWLYQAISGCLVTGATGELNERGRWGERERETKRWACVGEMKENRVVLMWIASSKNFSHTFGRRQYEAHSKEGSRCAYFGRARSTITIACCSRSRTTKALGVSLILLWFIVMLLRICTIKRYKSKHTHTHITQLLNAFVFFGRVREIFLFYSIPFTRKCNHFAFRIVGVIFNFIQTLKFYVMKLCTFRCKISNIEHQKPNNFCAFCEIDGI